MRGVLLARAALLVAVAAVLACGALVGPATKRDSTYTFKCPDGLQVCDVGTQRCSATKPYRCIDEWVGASRDGGAK